VPLSEQPEPKPGEKAYDALIPSVGKTKGPGVDFGCCLSEIEPGQPGGCPPGFPQIRTCPIKAYGSSSHGFATEGHTEWTARAGGSGYRPSIRTKRSQE
jgi:hypothetical protein